MLHEGGEGIDWSKDIDNMEILAAKVNALKPKPSFIFCTGKTMDHIMSAIIKTFKVADVRFGAYLKFIPGTFTPPVERLHSDIGHFCWLQVFFS